MCAVVHAFVVRACRQTCKLGIENACDLEIAKVAGERHRKKHAARATGQYRVAPTFVGETYAAGVAG